MSFQGGPYSEKTGIYQAGSFPPGTAFPPSAAQAGYPVGPGQPQRYTPVTQQQYAVASNPSLYTPTSAYSPHGHPLSAAAYQAAAQQQAAAGYHQLQYSTLQTTTPGPYAQYATPAYLTSHMGPTAGSPTGYATGIPVASQLYPGAQYTQASVPGMARGYPAAVNPMAGYPGGQPSGYPAGTNPASYPGGSPYGPY